MIHVVVASLLGAAVVISAAPGSEDVGCFQSLQCLPHPVDKVEAPVKLSVPGWEGAKITAGVAKILLEEKLGVPVELVETTESVAWDELANGHVHASLEVWGTSSDELYKHTVELEDVQFAGALGVSGYEGFFVPSYLLPGKTVVTPNDLYEIAESLDKTYHGYNFNWAGEQFNEALLKTQFSSAFKPKTYADWNDLEATVTKALDAQKPIFFGAWYPHPIFETYNLRRVSLPPHRESCTPGDCGHEEVSSAVKVLWPGLEDTNPKAFNFIRDLNVRATDQMAIMKQMANGENICKATCDYLKKNSKVYDYLVSADVKGAHAKRERAKRPLYWLMQVVQIACLALFFVAFRKFIVDTALYVAYSMVMGLWTVMCKVLGTDHPIMVNLALYAIRSWFFIRSVMADAGMTSKVNKRAINDDPDASTDSLASSDSLANPSSQTPFTNVLQSIDQEAAKKRKSRKFSFKKKKSK
eukprot:Clim_evm115s109 gene=Clim_evmTU115s109